MLKIRFVIKRTKIKLICYKFEQKHLYMTKIIIICCDKDGHGKSYCK
jgi:hypothetical protein